MNRASASDLRRAMVAADAFKTAGILFIPLPVMREEDHAILQAELARRLELIEKLVEAV